MRYIDFPSTLLLSALSSAMLLTNFGTYAQQQADHAQDCTVFAIDDNDDETLTQAERVAQMDKALSDSVDRYDVCVRKGMGDGKGNGNGSGNGSGSAGDGTGSGSGVAQQPVETPQQPTQAEQVPEAQPQQNQTPREQMEHSGAIPKDIPPKDNDSVLQRQIREAAMKEQDPVKREKLWALYRKYMNQ